MRIAIELPDVDNGVASDALQTIASLIEAGNHRGEIDADGRGFWEIDPTDGKTAAMAVNVQSLSDENLRKELDIAPGMESGSPGDPSRLWTALLRHEADQRELHIIDAPQFELASVDGVPDAVHGGITIGHQVSCEHADAKLRRVTIKQTYATWSETAIEVTVPADVEDLDEWGRENFDRLFDEASSDERRAELGQERLTDSHMRWEAEEGEPVAGHDDEYKVELIKPDA